MAEKGLSPDIAAFLEQATTARFLAAARCYVSVTEANIPDKDAFFCQLHPALVELYAAGFGLNPIPLKYSDESSDFDDASLYSLGGTFAIPDLGREGLYWEIYDPRYTEWDGKPGPGWKAEDGEPCQGWLWDDLSDIHRDLKIRLKQIDTIGTNEAVEDALWQMKWSFTHHWGEHCINALKYLHYLYYEGKVI